MISPGGRRLRKILRIFLTIQLFKQCAGICDESYTTETYSGRYYKYMEDFSAPTALLTELRVDCEEVELPITWVRRNIRIDSDWGGCTKVLTITHSNLTVVPPAAFKGFSTFSILRLSDLHLETLKPGAFNSLNSLSKLYLFGNKLRVIGTGIFNSLTNLEVLDLSKNEIQNINADSLAGVIYLRSLNLSSNRLVLFESAILDPYILFLENVDLSFNNLSNIYIGSVSSKIKNIDLFGNNIKELNFCPFELKSLNVSKNIITLLKKDYCAIFSKIVHLDVSFNNISELDSKIFANLRNLKYLNLQHNNISSIPTELFSDLSNLIALNLSHNQFQQFQFGTFEYLENLQILDISHNKLTILNRFLHPLSNLGTLYIQANNITFLNVMKLVQDLPNLYFISFENNDFSCNELIDVMHYFRKKGIHLEYGRIKNTTNVHGISCSDDEHFRISSIDNILSKLDQLVNDDLKKSVVNDYFNNEFKNSNFYKYLENFHEMNLPKFNEDYENDYFYKYSKNLRNSNNFISRRSDAQRFSGYIDEQNNKGLFTTMVLLLVVVVVLIIIFLYMYSTRRTSERRENVELLEA